MTAERNAAYRALTDECFSMTIDALTEIKESEDGAKAPHEVALAFGLQLQAIIQHLEREFESIGRMR